ncbi:hypothetical protein, partial [Salinibacter ruber]|uniref:hypothetical protein n=1 Tax=Salinibacter ruber TaxID=146919 RepID=UPI002168EBD0
MLFSKPVLFLLAPVEDLKHLLRAGSSPGRKASRKGSLTLRTSQISRFSPLVRKLWGTQDRITKRDIMPIRGRKNHVAAGSFERGASNISNKLPLATW